jgi:GNAT superfamily N-acetyltransferase
MTADAVEIRPIREAELDELFDFLCLVHQHPQGRARYHSYVHGDPTWAPWQTPVVVIDGRLVSTLRIWDRQIHVGATPLRMGGIGGVTTHPDYRRRGLATAMMAHAADTMRSAGMSLGLLFTEIPARFYRRLGWCNVPLAGFQASLHHRNPPACEADVVAFEEKRDLQEVIALHQRYNAGRSGTMLRPRTYWDCAPSRARGVLPDVVVRDDTSLVGYLNWELRSDGAHVKEVAWSSVRGLKALVQHLLVECAAREVTRMFGEIPHNHAFVDTVVAIAEADLHPAGCGSMMALPMDLPALIERVAPEATEALCRLPTDLLCRLLFGESSATDLMAVLQARGIEIDVEEMRRLDELCPRRELIFWQPDHF